MKKIFILMTIVAATFFIAACGPVKDGQYAKLAQCLTDKGVKFYGAYWCSHCADQEKIFGDDIRYVPYVECYPGGSKTISKQCVEAGVKSYPTWFFPGQGNATGVLQPDELAKMPNCEDALKADLQPVKSESAGTDDSSSLKKDENTTESTPAKDGLTIQQVNPDGSTTEIKPNITTETLPPKADATELVKGIAITKDGFTPAQITMKVGGKIIFQNVDDKEHWPASDPHPVHSIEPDLDSKKGLKKDETFEYTFTKAGTYPFHDHLNPNFRGTITIIE